MRWHSKRQISRPPSLTCHTLIQNARWGRWRPLTSQNTPRAWLFNFCQCQINSYFCTMWTFFHIHLCISTTWTSLTQENGYGQKELWVGATMMTRQGQIFFLAEETTRVSALVRWHCSKWIRGLLSLFISSWWASLIVMLSNASIHANRNTCEWHDNRPHLH